MSKRLTTEDFIAKAKLIHGDKYDYSLVNYINSHTKINIICKNHGIFKQSPTKHLSGHGCNFCGVIKQKETCIEKYGTSNPFQSTICKEKRNITMIKKYGSSSPIQNKNIRTKIENTNIIRYGVKNPFQNKNIINKIVENRDYVSIVKKTKETLEKTHNVSCALQLKTTRENLLASRRSDILNGLFRGNRLNDKVSPLFTESQYIDVITEYEWKCNSCSTIFKDHLDDGRIPRCNICYPYIIDSKYEYEIIDFIKTFYTGNIIHGNRQILHGKELDIYIPNNNLAIEFNGLYYHSELTGNKDKNYHLNKTNECEKLGIRLIHIFEDEWRSKKEIVKSRLRHILGGCTSKIFARKCKVKILDSAESNIFLDKNHLQGKDNSAIRLGLFYNNELISVMTFGKLRKALGQCSKSGKYEMYRYCSALNISAIGGANKLFSYFIKNYTPLSVISYADKRWSNGDLYEKIDFKFLSTSTPSYFYTKDHYKKYHRFNFRKSELSKKLSIFNPCLSEWENMKLNGYDRIWDCGNFKYEWVNYPINIQQNIQAPI